MTTAADKYPDHLFTDQFFHERPDHVTVELSCVVKGRDGGGDQSVEAGVVHGNQAQRARRWVGSGRPGRKA